LAATTWPTLTARATATHLSATFAATAAFIALAAAATTTHFT
jgi:hypothetical protein